MDPIAVTAALLRAQLPDVPLREGASMMARVASRGASHAVIVIAGVPVKAQIPPEVQAGATLRLRVQEVTPERVLLQIVPQPGAAKAPAQGQPAAARPASAAAAASGSGEPAAAAARAGSGPAGPPGATRPDPPAAAAADRPTCAGRAGPGPAAAWPAAARRCARPTQARGAAAASRHRASPNLRPLSSRDSPRRPSPRRPRPRAQPGQATPARTEQGQTAPGQPPVPAGGRGAAQREPAPAAPARAPPAGPRDAPAPEASAAAQDAVPAPRTEQAAQQPQIPTPTVGQPPLTQHQRVDVQVEEPPTRRQGADGEQSAVVSLTFNSPALGQLDLRLELRGERILAEITTPAGRPHAIAHSGAERLRAKLEEVGLEPTVKVRPRSEPLDLYA